MLLNYLKLSLRLLVSSPFFSLVNLLGLSCGFAAFFVLWQYTWSELNIDTHYKDHERIGRIGCYWSWKEEVSIGQMSCGSIPSDQMTRIAEDFPEVSDYTRLEHAQFGASHTNNKFVFSVPERKGERQYPLSETNIISVDSNFFDFFGIQLLQGEMKSALRNPNSVALSRTTAVKYFGEESPLNRMLVLNDTITLKVTGVYEDFGRNTHLNASVIFSNSGYRNTWDTTSGRWATCYFKLNTGHSFSQFEEAIQVNKKKYWAEELTHWLTSDGKHFVQPLTDVAFSNHYWGDHFWPRSRLTLNTLAVVSILILLMAWVNHLNLAISRMGRRWKEIIARKVTGALTTDLTRQFMIESTVNHAFAIGLALTMVQVIRQPMIELYSVEIPQLSKISPEIWLSLACVTVIGIVLTGFYPAMISRLYRPGAALSFVAVRPGRSISSILTTFQYAMATVLILWVSVVFFQLDFILNMNLGFDKSNVVLLDLPATGTPAFESHFNEFMQTVRTQHPATYGQSLMGDDDQWRVRMRRPGQQDFFQVDSNGGVDETFIPFFGLRMLAGRNFVSGDRDEVVIVSRYAAKRLGYPNPEDAIGALVEMEKGKASPLEVIGIMEDYALRPFVNYGGETGHLNNSREDGIVLTYKNGNWPTMLPGKIAVRIDPDQLHERIASLELAFMKSFPTSIFKWSIQDEYINRLYDQEKIFRRQISLLTVLTIGIACLGLVGMVANLAEEKTKELGIRKVLGANFMEFSSVLLKSTYLQLTVGMLAGLPIGWILGQQYLEKYSHQVDLLWWHVAAPLIFLIIIMTLAISYLLIRAVQTNPVESLRNE